MFDDVSDDEIKEIDDELCAKEAEAYAKQVAEETKKKSRSPWRTKKKRKSNRKKTYRTCTAGACERKPTHTVVRVKANIEGDKINFTETPLILPSCERHAAGMLRRFKNIGVPNVRIMERV